MGTTLKSEKQPDRFAQCVAKRFPSKVRSQSMSVWYAKSLAEQLIRAEHRAVVRLVKQLRPCAKPNNPLTQFGEAYQLACDKLLAALSRRMK